MIALLVVIAVLISLALLKIGVTIIWEDGLTLRLIVGPFQFKLGTKKEPANSSENKTAKKPKEKKKSPWGKIIRQNWQELLELLGRVFRLPMLDPLILKVIFGGEDPASSAINYGRAWAIVGVLMPVLEHSFRIGKREIDVKHDPDVTKISFYAKISFKARIGNCIFFAFAVLKLFLRLYRETKQSEKAVQIV